MAGSGRIVTFWSARGGVGCSMALANVAWILATNKQRVLVIDWDLEAPGLQRYFKPFLEDQDSSHPGLMDLLYDYVATLHAPAAIAAAHASADTDPSFAGFIQRLNWDFPVGGHLDFMSAGRREPQFDWFRFYDHMAGGAFLERLRRALLTEYDYVLIDGRTGVSDTAGICTIQMPDVLAGCFTLTDSLDAEILARVFERAMSSQHDRTIRILPIPTKVDPSIKSKVTDARRRISALFEPFLGDLPSGTAQQYWADVEVPYDPFYSYGAVLSTFGDASGWPRSVLASMERICARLTLGEVRTLPPVSRDQRRRVCLAFGTSPNHATGCFISYSTADLAFASKLRDDLEKADIECWIASRDLRIGAEIRPAIDRAMRARENVVIILSRHSIASAWVKKEAETAFENQQRTGDQLLFPIRIDSEVMDTEVAWAADIRRQRNIKDFSAWPDDDQYRAALERLIHSLRIGDAS
jgi:hypothetical protein